MEEHLNATLIPYESEPIKNYKLVALIYFLIRDHIQPGVIETLMKDISYEGNINFLSNYWLVGYSKDIVERLTENTNEEKIS